MAEIDLELVRHALGVARQRGFAEVELRVGEDRFAAALDPLPPSAVPAMVASAEAAEAVLEIRATLVGYARNASPTLSVGQRVEKGQVVAVIDALGLANDVESPVAGVVTELLVAPGDPVQYGQVLARLKA